MKTKLDWARSALRPAILFLFIAACGGDGCACVSPIPGGFPPEERVANAVQVRVSDTGIAALEADPGALIGGLVGDGGAVITFDVPPSCGDPKICCDSNDNLITPCGPILIDLDERPGDPPRLELSPVQGQSRLDLVVRARLKTVNDLPIIYSGISCNVRVDTEMAGVPSLRLVADLSFTQDPDAGTTRIEVGDVAVHDIDNGDISISGGILCALGDAFKGLFIDDLIDGLADSVRDAISDQLCKQCPGGTDDECGPFATGCEGGVCMKEGGECLQELGIAGRLAAHNLLGALSPGTLGAIDLYQVAGGYATTDGGGIALGLLGGALPGGQERDRCGPSAAPPAPVSIAQSAFFAGNTRPDTGAPFDFALGVHHHDIDLIGWAAYDGGFLCLNIGTGAIDLLTTETLVLVMPSVIDLMHGRVGPIVLGLRPQAPPIIVLGENTFVEGGGGNVSIDEPLLDITLPELDIDFYTMVDDQYIRVMTLRADVHLPIGLEVTGEGELQPVLGDLGDAFTNLSVRNSEALLESPEELADKFPALLALALPLVADGLGTFALPELGGLTMRVDAITTVEDNAFLAIFGTFDLGSSAAAAPVRTEARLLEVTVPPTSAFLAPRRDRQLRPTVRLALGGQRTDGVPANLEWAFRVDGGLWSPYTRSPEVELSREVFWLQGRHRIEVRAREVGKPETTDPNPVLLEPVIDTLPPRAVFSQPSPDAVWVMGTDNVSKGRLAASYRIGGGAWQPIELPAAVELGGASPAALEVRLVDEVGNQALASPGDLSTPPLIGFHGAAGQDGCDCMAADGRAGLGGALLVLLCAGALARRTRRRLWAALHRAALPAALWLAVAAATSLSPGCSCSSAAPCGEIECLEGEVERGPTGRYNAVAADGDRIVVSAYDQGLGDLVLIDVAADGTRSYQAVDGIPEGTPVYHPSTYRGGIVGAGPNVGAWTAVTLDGGRALLAYQDVDASALKYAGESDDGWHIHMVDAGDGGAAGLYSRIAVDGGGVPAIAYLVVGVDDGAGGALAQLRYARASSPYPQSSGDWTVTVVDEAAITCAGLCGAGTRCVVAGATERCAATTSDCGDCGGGQVCVAGVCVAAVPDPPAHDVPPGTGLFLELVRLGDGRPAIVHYDRTGGDLVMHVLDGDWTRVALDAGAGTDHGMWASAAVDAAGTLHVAYQDALGDQLLYVTWANGAVGPVEVVDDGTRAGDRPHPVGAGARLFVDGAGGVAIAYQDGATADLLIARRGPAGWTWDDLLSGPDLLGFYVDAATAGGKTWITSYAYDRAYYPPGELLVITIP
jgi:hypothetical protein